VDDVQFDRLSRLIARTATRRSAFGLAAALGLRASLVDAGKKHKNKCKGGCGPCQVCKKQGKKKKCVPAPSSATCASLGKTCGTADDGCGGTLECGTCGLTTTPSCDDGTCTICSIACPGDTCIACNTLTNGSTVCAAFVNVGCDHLCVRNSDCPADFPFCTAYVTTPGDNDSGSLPETCNKNTPGVCTQVLPC
jgi:hypothetical protein